MSQRPRPADQLPEQPQRRFLPVLQPTATPVRPAVRLSPTATAPVPTAPVSATPVSTAPVRTTAGTTTPLSATPVPAAAAVVSPGTVRRAVPTAAAELWRKRVPGADRAQFRRTTETADPARLAQPVLRPAVGARPGPGPADEEPPDGVPLRTHRRPQRRLQQPRVAVRVPVRRQPARKEEDDLPRPDRHRRAPRRTGQVRQLQGRVLRRRRHQVRRRAPRRRRSADPDPTTRLDVVVRPTGRRVPSGKPNAVRETAKVALPADLLIPLRSGMTEVKWRN